MARNPRRDHCGPYSWIILIGDAVRKKTLEAMKEFPEGQFLNKEVQPPAQPTIKAEVAFLGMIMHEVHHRTQLFTYLKMLGLPVDSRTLFEP